MLVLLMEKFLLLLKNHPFHLLHHPLYHHNHFMISLPLPKHNQHLHNHLSEIITAVSTTITAAEAQVPAATLTAAPSRVTTAPSRRRKRVVIRDPQEESTTSTIIPAETKSKDKGKRILIEEEESRALKRINETPTERAAKRQKLDEEVEELKRHLQIVPNEDDDVTQKLPYLLERISRKGSLSYGACCNCSSTPSEMTGDYVSCVVDEVLAVGASFLIRVNKGVLVRSPGLGAAA
nr:hypothetical protein [Tanacetum cinerariifolium]